NYPAELEKLLDAITHENIRGVLFLTGDRHHTELTRLERYGTYPLYDLTISPLTAGPARGAEKEANYLRIPETLVTGKHNFAILSFSGPRKNRVMTITVFDKDGKELWSKAISEKELR
ncbi:MAG: alkaline phosphatase family protein, partial [Methanobacteriota archaeon]